VGLYLVERYTPSLGAEQVAAAVRRLDALGATGTSHMWTVLMPAEETCLSLFAAASATAVAEANRRADFTFTRIVDAVAFTAAGREDR
jgi:hypothetical protein